MIPFSGKCFRMWREAASAYSPRDLCTRVLYVSHRRGEGCLRGWRMSRCDNGLKRDAVLLSVLICANVMPGVRNTNAKCHRRQPPNFVRLKMIFSRRVETVEKLYVYIYFIFLIPRISELTCRFSNWWNKWGDFFDIYSLIALSDCHHANSFSNVCGNRNI